jgi:hypothetical protein
MNINELLRPPPAQAQHNEDVHAQPPVIDPQLQSHFEQSYSGSQTLPNQPSSYYSSPYPSLEIIPVDLEEASKQKGAKRKRNAEASARCRERRALREREAEQRISELEQTAQRISEARGENQRSGKDNSGSYCRPPAAYLCTAMLL